MEKIKHTENQNPEFAPTGMITRTFPALLDRNFKLYFTGQFISTIGTWLQNVALGWLVFEMTRSALWVGAIAAAGLTPVLVFGLFAGALVDRADRRKIILTTQSIAMVLAAILGILTTSGVITIYEIFVLAILLGMVNAFDIPARQAMLAEMMPKQYLTSSIALNSATNNTSRILGPAVAGVLIALLGSGGTFLLNAASYGAAILAIFNLRHRSVASEVRIHPIQAIREGISYTFSHPAIRTSLIAMSSVALIGYSFSSILPAVTGNVFHGNATMLGYLFASSGLGSVVATILISTRARAWGEHRFARTASALLSATFLVFAFTTNFFLGLLVLFFFGLSLTGTSSTLTTLIQHRVEGALRGRVISLVLISFTSAMALGSFLMGYSADHFGYRRTLLGSALGALLVVAFLLLSERIGAFKEQNAP